MIAKIFMAATWVLYTLILYINPKYLYIYINIYTTSVN